MSVIDTLITDRRESDIGQNAKGSYNASDLNRVGEACAYLYGEFTRFGYTLPGYTPLRTDWTESDVPTQSDMRTYLATVASLREMFEIVTALPESMSRLTVEGANDIESVLVEIDTTIRRMVYSFHRTDEFGLHSGETFVPTAYTDYGRTWEELDALGTTWANWDAADWYLLLYGNLKAEA